VPQPNVEWACGFIDTHTTITTPIPLFGDVDTPTATGDRRRRAVRSRTPPKRSPRPRSSRSARPTTTPTTLTGFTTPTAATYYTVRIQLIGDAAYCWVNGVLRASHTGSKVEGGNLLRPWVYVRTRDTTDHLTDIDYVELWANRA
jgi:hypothetical protein